MREINHQLSLVDASENILEDVKNDLERAVRILINWIIRTLNLFMYTVIMFPSEARDISV